MKLIKKLMKFVKGPFRAARLYNKVFAKYNKAYQVYKLAFKEYDEYFKSYKSEFDYQISPEKIGELGIMALRNLCRKVKKLYPDFKMHKGECGENIAGNFSYKIAHNKEQYKGRNYYTTVGYNGCIKIKEPSLKTIVHEIAHFLHYRWLGCENFNALSKKEKELVALYSEYTWAKFYYGYSYGFSYREILGSHTKKDYDSILPILSYFYHKGFLPVLCSYEDIMEDFKKTDYTTSLEKSAELNRLLSIVHEKDKVVHSMHKNLKKIQKIQERIPQWIAVFI